MPAKQNCASAQMLIRKPVAYVFQAFIDPSITKNFWFTKGSGKLEVNEKLVWEWEMYRASAVVTPLEIAQNEKILFEWGEPARTVEIYFTSLNESATYVTVTEWGYHQTGDELIAVIKDSTGGFTTVLDGAKAYLEHGIQLNLIADKFPPEIVNH